ncbi:MAG: GNAT family N-acetyltransferase [Acidimicrobiia bacterium]|nr:GNAT family N-acetyltransferase [Acidimicrobiia bacterium]
MDLPTEYNWRPLRLDDIDQLVAMYARWEERHDLLFRSDRAELGSDLAHPDGDLATRSICALDSGGTIRGIGWVFRRDQTGVSKQRALVWAIPDPDHSHLEEHLIRWATETASGLLDGLDDGLDKVLRAWSPSHIADRIGRFEAQGFHVARYFATLSRPVAGAPDPVPPDGITLVDWDQAAHGRAIFEAHREAFSDHWGSVPPDWEAWQSDHVDDEHTRLDLSPVALAGDAVVGYSLNQVWPDDVEVRGLTEAYLGAIGVRKTWRRRGVATALILESIRRIAAAGLDNATLTTDTDSLTGAFALYTQLGFEEVNVDVTLVKEL